MWSGLPAATMVLYPRAPGPRGGSGDFKRVVRTGRNTKGSGEMRVLRVKTPGVTMSINSREAVEALYSALTVAYSFEKNRGLPAEGTLHDLWWQMRKVRQEQASSSPQT